MANSLMKHFRNPVSMALVLILLLSACADSNEESETAGAAMTNGSESDSVRAVDNSTFRDPKTIPVMIYCSNKGTTEVSWRVFPDPIIVRPEDSVVFYVHDANAEVDMTNFRDEIQNNSNPVRRLDPYDGKETPAPPLPPSAPAGNRGKAGTYTLVDTASPKEATVTIDVSGCDSTKRPFVGNPTMIIED